MRKIVVPVLLCICSATFSQQVADVEGVPEVKSPAYKAGAGPVVMIDEAHHNFHTAEGRFRPFATLLERDGYQIRRGTESFSLKSLQDVRVLVISNALHVRNTQEWTLPTPSAFTDEEIEAVVAWVKSGGSLFLISDHMPFPGNNEKLAAAFGFTFYNGFAFDTTKQQGPDHFSFANKRLVEGQLTQGLDDILTFTGQGFDIPPAAKPVLMLDEKFKIFISDTAWVFNDNTKKLAAKGKCQGAFLIFGQGRVVVFGEAAMLTAQIAGGTNRVGFNHPEAKNNAALVLRLIHWLDKG